MDTLHPTVARHDYGLKGWLKVFYLVISVTSAGYSLYICLTSAETHIDFFFVSLAGLLAILGAFFASIALRSRLVIDRDHIEVRGAFRERSAELNEIEGYRTIRDRNGSYTKFYLKQGHGTITMSNYFATDDDFRSWLQQITDLDLRDRDALLTEISEQQDLGATSDERLATLSRAQTTSILALVVAIAAAAAVNFGEPILQAPFAVALSLVPVALAMLMQRSPLLYSVFKRKSDPRAELSFALIVTSFGFLFRNRGIHLVSIEPLLIIIAVVALAYCAAFVQSSSQSTSPIGTVIALLLFAGMYSYGVAVAADSLADHSKASTFAVEVTGKRISRGRSTTYYLRLAPWGPMDSPNEISVSRATYDGFVPGQQLCISLHQGRLHAPWYRAVSCSAQPDAITQ
jgi:uncharacterized protein (DUF697 family)